MTPALTTSMLLTLKVSSDWRRLSKLDRLLLFSFVPVKKQNYTQLIKDLQGQLLGNVSASARLLCHASPNQLVSCLRGMCELSSGGGSSFVRRCRQGVSEPQIQISSRTVDNDSVESMFTYHCNKNSCNDEIVGNEVRKRLNETGLLRPRGVGLPESAGNSISPMMALGWLACLLALVGHWHTFMIETKAFHFFWSISIQFE